MYDLVSTRSSPPAPSLRRRVRTLLRNERGISLVELLTSMAILMIVVGSLGTLFVSGSNAETDLNRRFTAQENARLALDQLRHDVHNSCAATVTTGASTQSVALTVPGAAPSFTCTASYTWCTIGSGSRYKLYCKAASSCDATGRLEADYLTSYNLFTAVAASGSSLTKLSIDFPVDVNPGSSPNKYELTDSIGIRNSGRT